MFHHRLPSSPRENTYRFARFSFILKLIVTLLFTRLFSIAKESNCPERFFGNRLSEFFCEKTILPLVSETWEWNSFYLQHLFPTVVWKSSIHTIK